MKKYKKRWPLNTLPSLPNKKRRRSKSTYSTNLNKLETSSMNLRVKKHTSTHTSACRTLQGTVSKMELDFSRLSSEKSLQNLQFHRNHPERVKVTNWNLLHLRDWYPKNHQRNYHLKNHHRLMCIWHHLGRSQVSDLRKNRKVSLQTSWRKASCT